MPKDEVLVKVHASTVTRSDAMRVRSDQYRFARLATGLRRPRRTTLGIKFARDRAPRLRRRLRAEAGANTEYLTARASEVIAPKPGTPTYEEAAAIPNGSLLALTCLARGPPKADAGRENVSSTLSDAARAAQV